MMSTRHIRGTVAAALMTLALGAQAHTAWFVPESADDTWRVLFGGHGGPDDTEPYAPAKVGEITAFDAAGNGVAVTRAVDEQGVTVAAPRAAVLLIHYDNGFWSRAGDESVNRPMNEVPGAESAVHAVKYGKAILDWSQATRVFDQPYELVLLNEAAPRAGDTVRVQVRIDGQPVAGIAVMHQGDAPGVRTDEDGVAELPVQEGTNHLWSGRRSTVENDPRYTSLSIEYMLTFEAVAQ